VGKKRTAAGTEENTAEMGIRREGGSRRGGQQAGDIFVGGKTIQRKRGVCIWEAHFRYVLGRKGLCKWEEATGSWSDLRYCKKAVGHQKFEPSSQGKEDYQFPGETERKKNRKKRVRWSTKGKSFGAG